MDWTLAIEKNSAALKRILAAIVAMAGLADGSRTHLPRHLHRAVLRLLRPAESATRRLIVVAGRGVTVTLPPLVARRPRGGRHSAFVRPGMRTGIVLARAMRPRMKQPSPRLSLPLFDKLPELGPRRPRGTSPSQAPRIRSLHSPLVSSDHAALRPLRPAPAGDDPIEAHRLRLRLEALGRALSDLPGQAQRLARWRAARARALAASDDRSALPLRFRRHSPLKPGCPPGSLRRPTHEVHQVLARLQGLANWALEPPDPS